MTRADAEQVAALILEAARDRAHGEIVVRLRLHEGNAPIVDVTTTDRIKLTGIPGGHHERRQRS